MFTIIDTLKRKNSLSSFPRYRKKIFDKNWKKNFSPSLLSSQINLGDNWHASFFKEMPPKWENFKFGLNQEGMWKVTHCIIQVLYFFNYFFLVEKYARLSTSQSRRQPSTPNKVTTPELSDQNQNTYTTLSTDLNAVSSLQASKADS